MCLCNTFICKVFFEVKPFRSNDLGLVTNLLTNLQLLRFVYMLGSRIRSCIVGTYTSFFAFSSSFFTSTTLLPTSIARSIRCLEYCSGLYTPLCQLDFPNIHFVWDYNRTCHLAVALQL